MNLNPCRNIGDHHTYGPSLPGNDIGLAMISVGFIGYFLITNQSAAFGLLRLNPATVSSNFSFCVVHLFIMMGNFGLCLRHEQIALSDGL